ncbi:MAG TPA: helix-turn-helix transcriptional regulator [Burkholderiales bacterium]|nr:helix-turn-helix transcriptional regulator [Burkholderiales bacterium]
MRALLGETFYNVSVTTAEMWLAVGKKLQQARLEKNWLPTEVERVGGPSYKTVQAIEKGKAGNVEKLDQCARALGLDIVDILYSVLESRVTPLSPEAAHLVRKFTETTVAGRHALISMADALPPAGATTPSTPAWPAGSKASYRAMSHRCFCVRTLGRAAEDEGMRPHAPFATTHPIPENKVPAIGFSYTAALVLETL